MIQLCTSVSYSRTVCACITERTMDSRCTYLQRDMICIRPFPRLSPHLEKRTANRLCESTRTRRTGECGRTPGELITAIWIKKSQNPEASEGKLMPPLANCSRLSCSCTADNMYSTRTISTIARLFTGKNRNSEQVYKNRKTSIIGFINYKPTRVIVIVSL